MSIHVRQPSTLAESNLLLALALLEKDCDCWQVIDRNEGRTGTIRKAPDVFCSKCAGKGKVPLLDPALVRKPCPNPYCKNGWDSKWACPTCKGRGWMPSPDILDWIRALNKENLRITFFPGPTVEIRRDCIPYLDIEKGKTIYEAAAQVFGVDI